MSKVFKVIVVLATLTVLLSFVLLTLRLLKTDQNAPKSKRRIAIESVTLDKTAWTTKAVKFGNSDDFFVIIGYGNDPQNHPKERDLNLKSRAGILVFKVVASSKLVRFWESSEPMSGVGIPGIEFDDLNNDGIPELLAFFLQSQYNESLYIYKYDSQSQQISLISPTEIAYGGITVSAFYGDLRGFQIEDIDKDGVKEVAVSNTTITTTDPNLPYPQSVTNSRIIKKTYKWSGTEYYLWKEEKVVQ